MVSVPQERVLDVDKLSDADLSRIKLMVDSELKSYLHCCFILCFFLCTWNIVYIAERWSLLCKWWLLEKPVSKPFVEWGRVGKCILCLVNLQVHFARVVQAITSSKKTLLA